MAVHYSHARHAFVAGFRRRVALRRIIQLAYNTRTRTNQTAGLMTQLFGVGVSTIVPYIFLSVYLPADQDIGLARASLIGSLAAALLGFWIFRSITAYPGTERVASVLPAFSGAYAVLLVTFFLSRMEYSRILLIGSYFIVTLWFYLVALVDRTPKTTFGIIGEDEELEQLLRETRGIRWKRIDGANASIDGVDAIAVDLRASLDDDWERRLADYALIGLPVYHKKHLIESLSGRVPLEHLSENQFGMLSPLGVYMEIKRTIDWLSAAVAMIVLLPLLLIVALSIKLDSPGTIFFRQVRIGYRGQPFRVLKFRTMRPVEQAATDARNAAMTKDGDVRVTRLGGFLRKSRIDELPQIFNILRGEMSWIGPRPEAEVLSRWYEAEIPFYRYRHIVRPGITGWAQVNQGHVVDIADVTSKLHYDFYYIKNFGYWIDALIVARTIKTMMTGYGAK